jgi:hypothetical protein
MMKEIKWNREIIKKMYEVFADSIPPNSILKKTHLNFGCITGINDIGQTLLGDYEIRRMENHTFQIVKN